MAGWDLTVLSAALSLLGGIIWSVVSLALGGSGSARKKADELTEMEPEFGGAVSWQGND